MEDLPFHIDRLKESFLCAASLHGMQDDVRSLIDLGASLKWTNTEGDTPLICACRGGHSEIVLLLLVSGADPSQKNTVTGKTALHYSCQRGDEVASSILLEQDVKLAAIKDSSGSTPYEVASSAGHRALSDRLREALITGKPRQLTRVAVRGLAAQSPSLAPLRTPPAPCDRSPGSRGPRGRGSEAGTKTSAHISAHEPGALKLTLLPRFSEAFAPSGGLRPSPPRPLSHSHRPPSNSNSTTEARQHCHADESKAQCDCGTHTGTGVGAESGAACYQGGEGESRSTHSANAAADHRAGTRSRQGEENHTTATPRQAQVEREMEVVREQSAQIWKQLMDCEDKLATVRRERDELQTIVTRLRGHSLDAMGLPQVDAFEHELKEVLERVSRHKERILLEHQEMRLCVVCQEREKTVLLLPCRHLCLCARCSEHGEIHACPLCRRDICQRIDVFA